MSEGRALELFLAGNQGLLNLPVALAVVSDYGGTVEDASTDGNVLRAQLRALPPVSHLEQGGGEPSAFQPQGRHVGSDHPSGRANNESAREHGRTNLNRRFTAAVLAFLNLVPSWEDIPGRSFLLPLGRGWPMLSEADFVVVSARAKASYFQTIVGLANALREAQLTGYNVSSPQLSGTDAKRYVAFLPGIQPAEQARAGDLSLQVLSVQSGGAVVDSNENLDQEIRDCLKQADAYYAVAIDAQPSESFDEYHSLRMTIVGRPDLTAVTNAG